MTFYCKLLGLIDRQFIPISNVFCQSNKNVRENVKRSITNSQCIQVIKIRTSFLKNSVVKLKYGDQEFYAQVLKLYFLRSIWHFSCWCLPAVASIQTGGAVSGINAQASLFETLFIYGIYMGRGLSSVLCARLLLGVR